MCFAQGKTPCAAPTFAKSGLSINQIAGVCEITKREKLLTLLLGNRLHQDLARCVIAILGVCSNDRHVEDSKGKVTLTCIQSPSLTASSDSASSCGITFEAAPGSRIQLHMHYQRQHLEE